jgi:hypothetical protein
MAMFICTSCGTQYADSDLPPSSCPICCADGDPVPEPRWTTLDATSHRWVMRSDRVVRLWEGNALGLLDEVTLIHVSTYNQGGTMLHRPAGAGGEGALLTGDVIQVLAQRQRVGFLSNPRDLVPRAAECVRRLVSAVEPMSFEAVHDALADGSIEHDARAIVLRSAASYVAALSGQTDVKDPRCSMIA